MLGSIYYLRNDLVNSSNCFSSKPLEFSSFGKAALGYTKFYKQPDEALTYLKFSISAESKKSAVPYIILGSLL